MRMPESFWKGHRMTRRLSKSATALGIAAAALAAVIVGPAPSAQATLDDCPEGKFCLFRAKDHADSKPYSFTGSIARLPATIDDQAYSAANNTEDTYCIFQHPGFTGSHRNVKGEQAPVTLGVLNGKVSSVKHGSCPV
ncbi:peptidase inhibitor family I36 protein [Streptomyces sparsogenes]|uniref:peptidase inhibitor family I36 protein n=1 Tax=Streptomyces sparsogenes TaxID=67365 RepID=UPI00331FF36C